MQRFKIRFHSRHIIALQPQQHFHATQHLHARLFDDLQIRVKLGLVHAHVGAPIRDRIVTGKNHAAQPAPFGDFGVLLRVAARVFAERRVHVRIK